MKKYLLFLLLCCLSGCGFHFRSPADLPPQLKVMAIINSNTHSNLTSQLVATLQDLGVQVTAPPQSAPVTLVIISDNFTQSNNVLGTAQLLNSITLTYNVTFVLRDNSGKNLFLPTNVSSSTNYLQNANQVLGDVSIVPALQQQLVNDIVQKIIAKLAAQQTHTAVANNS